jgi:hypothetical protein
MTGPSAWPGSGWRPAGPGTGLAGTRTPVHQLVTQHGDNCRSLARNPALIMSGQGCLGGHQLSRSDPGRSVRILPGFGVHRRRLRTALSHGLTAAGLGATGKDRVLQRTPSAWRCGRTRRRLSGSRIGHPCGNLHRARSYGTSSRVHPSRSAVFPYEVPFAAQVLGPGAAGFLVGAALGWRGGRSRRVTAGVENVRVATHQRRSSPRAIKARPVRSGAVLTPVIARQAAGCPATGTEPGSRRGART